MTTKYDDVESETVNLGEVLAGKYKYEKTSNTAPLRLCSIVLQNEQGLQAGPDTAEQLLALLHDFAGYVIKNFAMALDESGVLKKFGDEKITSCYSPNNDTMLIVFKDTFFETNHDGAGKLYFSKVEDSDSRLPYYKALLAGVQRKKGGVSRPANTMLN